MTAAPKADPALPVLIRIGDKLLILDGDNIVDRLPHLKDLATPIAKHIKEVGP